MFENIIIFVALPSDVCFENISHIFLDVSSENPEEGLSRVVHLQSFHFFRLILEQLRIRGPHRSLYKYQRGENTSEAVILFPLFYVPTFLKLYIL
jgi:hypothetical protein